MTLAEPVIVARVARAHGIRGALLLEAETDHAEALFQPGQRLHVVHARETVPPTLTLSSARPHQDRWLVEVQEVADRTGAETCRGAQLAVDRADLPELPEGGYLLHDLIGMLVVDGEQPLGEVTDVYDQPGSPLLAVDVEGRERLVPFQPGLVERVDVAERRVYVTLPEGLLEI